MKTFIGVTDWDWFRQLRREEPDDVNFWRPSGKPFRALQPRGVVVHTEYPAWSKPALVLASPWGVAPRTRRWSTRGTC